MSSIPIVVDGQQEQQQELLDYSAIGFLVLDTLCHPAPPTLPPPGGASFVQRIRMTPAGTAGGTAMICGILLGKGRGQLVAQVADDDAGNFLLEKLQHTHGVNTNLITKVDAATGVQTSCSMLPIQKTAERAAFFCPGTSNTFTIDMTNQALVKRVLDARIIHLGGTGLLPQLDGLPSLQLLQAAKQLGRIVVFDLILANADTVPLVEPLLPYIDYFCPSIEEATALYQHSSDHRDSSDEHVDKKSKQQPFQQVAKIASHFKKKGVKNAILTMDKHGVYVDPEVGEPFVVPAHDINVVDTTGCGDSFTAGVIVGLIQRQRQDDKQEWDLRRIVTFANAVAAQVALGLGSDGDGNLKSIQETLQFMKTTSYRQDDDEE